MLKSNISPLEDVEAGGENPSGVTLYPEEYYCSQQDFVSQTPEEVNLGEDPYCRYQQKQLITTSDINRKWRQKLKKTWA